ncbi:MAG TPA: glycosyltransferase family 9 protein, partial [Verrucomicrobiae bacterium]
MPRPFARTSQRDFALAPGTVAIHPGCNRVSPWKRWHGFDELARRFSSVVLVGSDEDLQNDKTYFRRPFAWPAHVQNFIGKLNLPDTAALIQQCATLVSNDSGLMQLAVVLGVPTFGIFGITSPQREAIPVKNFFPIAKGLPCEAECRKGPWGRRDCNRHLECLKTLSAEEVFMKVNEIIPVKDPPATASIKATIAFPPESSAKKLETINVVYYGEIFDTSGYGRAARSYLHALNQAGINLSVVDLAGRRPAVADSLVESLVGRKIDADFHLFHGIPPHWARQAFPLRSVIAMTVWETDTMPSQWRPALSHALDVWLPCEFNASVFAAALQKPVFKLPHPWMPHENGQHSGNDLLRKWGIQLDDFVFYSIFEWQDRKGPREMIEAYLRAFPTDAGTVLVLKSNLGATDIAATTLAEVRRQISSSARVELRCEAWSEAEIAALQARGDCYVSLHRGEGWNLPLFEAACLGKPVVATGYSGPMEYLDAAIHHLVRYQPATVRQRYAYYQPAMHWAEPDIAHATELMRQVLTEREHACSRAATGAERLRQDFSLEVVGRSARQRLLHLLRKTNCDKWRRLHSTECRAHLMPTVPIPGEWYDADYFEHGLKSNWRDGYHWSSFSGLF